MESVVSILSAEQLEILAKELTTIQQFREQLPEFTRQQAFDRSPDLQGHNILRLRRLAFLQGLVVEKKITSHRKIIGPVIVFIKVKWRELVNRLVLGVVGRQIEVNRELWDLAFQVQLQDQRLTKIESALQSRGDIA
jgi:hypothetical protein